MWAGRGKRKLNINFFKQNKNITIINSMGSIKKIKNNNGKITIPISESPCYLKTNTKIKIIKPENPVYNEPKLEQKRIISSMNIFSKWKIVNFRDKLFENYMYTFKLLAKGRMCLTHNKKSIRVTMIPQPQISPIKGQYVIIKPLNKLS